MAKELEDIWNELLQLHWEYLETEENMQKIEMRKRLEGVLRDFLSLVRHDRKFFLTETAHVLKQSVLKMPDFTAYKALIGFEAIAQYANNLFRKPWRKEYRTIKMYSGYYQHEVKANLLDAERLFEAMGYTLMPNQTLVLEGPICPDQVTNVSRDAMTAYVECQIMKQVYHGLAAMQLTSTWKDIFKHRELAKEGSASQSIKDMALTIQERRYKTEKPSSAIENYPPVSTQIMCTPACASHVPAGPLAPCNHQHISQMVTAANPNVCHQNMCINKMIYANGMHMSGAAYPSYAHPTMPHSKSLEHYPDQNLINLNGHSRHSFDHPACEYSQRGHDCTDGVAMANYRQPSCAIDHPYNVSGNRYPLPVTISNQLSQVDSYAGEVPPPPPPPCALYAATGTPNIYSNGCLQIAGAAATAAPTSCCHQYFDCANRPLMPNMTEFNGAYGATSAACQKYYSAMTTEAKRAHRNGARSSSDHLIDFDEKSIAPKYSHTTAYKMDDSAAIAHRDIKAKHNDQQLLCKQLKYLQQQQSTHSGDEIDGIRKPTSARKPNRNAELLNEYEDHLLNNSRVSDFDSFDSSNNLSIDRNTGSTASKIQDGVGSYETWDYVFQNIGKNGYNNKNTTESKDLTMQGLGLSSAIANSSNEKRRSRNVEGVSNGAAAAIPISASKASGDGRTTTRSGELIDKPLSAIARASARTASKSPSSKEANNGPQKSAMKSNSAVQANDKNGALGNFVVVGNRAKTGTIKKVIVKSEANGSDAHREATTATSANSKANSTPTNTAVTSNGKSSTIEWACKHCTFLNPTTTNICQMCYKSKDFMPDGPKASTCV